MWTSTVNGWIFVEVIYTSQGLPTLGKVIKGNCNF